MKKILIAVIISLSLNTGCKAQNGMFSVFRAREGNFLRQIELRLCSEDILEYKLTISKEAGHPILEQKGYALIVDLEDQKKNGMDYEETISLDSKDIPVRQYLVTCNCEKWLNIKVPKDFSLIKVDCGDELINEINGIKVLSNPKSFNLGYFYKIK